MPKEEKESKPNESKPLEEVLNSPMAGEEIPTGFSTTKELAQADEMRVMQAQLSQALGVISKLAKKAGVKTELSVETGDFYGFIRSLDGLPIISWKMLPGSGVVLDRQDNIEDKQYIVVTTSDGKEHKMHYVEFDQRTKFNQIPVKILGYCVRNNVGEWRPKPYAPQDLHDVVLSTDRGETYDGEQIKIAHSFLN